MKRFVSLTLAFALTLVGLPALAADSPATLSGQILLAGDQTPIAGARVHLSDAVSGAAVASEPAADDGSFAIADLPPARYRVGVETDGKLYLVEGSVRLSPGQTQRLDLAIAPDLAPAQSTASAWDNPVTGALIVAGGAIILGLLIDSLTDDNKKESVASPR